MRCQLKASVTIARLTQLKERKLNQLRLKKQEKDKKQKTSDRHQANKQFDEHESAETSLDPTLTTYDQCTRNQIKQRVNNVVT